VSVAQPPGFTFWRQMPNGTARPGEGTPAQPYHSFWMSEVDNVMGVEEIPIGSGDFFYRPNWWTNSMFLENAGGVIGVPPNTPGSWGTGHLWVQGSLTNEGSSGIRRLDQLTVTGNLRNSNENIGQGSSIHHIFTINVLGNAANYGAIYSIDEFTVGGNLNNYAGATIGRGGNGEQIGTLSVSGLLRNYGPQPNPGRPRAEITNVWEIRAGILENRGLIQQLENGYLFATIDVSQDLFNGYNALQNDDLTPRVRRQAEILSPAFLSITTGGNLVQYFDGSIRAVGGNIKVFGELYNAGEIRIVTGGFNLVHEGHWRIDAGSIYNDGRSLVQWGQTGGTRAGNPYESSGGGAWGIIYDARINTAGNLTNIGVNAQINAMVNHNMNTLWIDTGSILGNIANLPIDNFNINDDRWYSLHVGGNLYNLDRASIFNYKEIIVHGDLNNRGATLVGGHWFSHSNLTDLYENPLMTHQTGLIQVGRSVYNTTETNSQDRILGGGTYGGLLAGFDTFDILGSVYNDANSMITGSYTHGGGDPVTGLPVESTGPYGIPRVGPGGEILMTNIYYSVGLDTKTPYTIYGRRANILDGVMLNGGSANTDPFNPRLTDVPSTLNVMGLSPIAVPETPAFLGLYNAGLISEIDIISVGSNEMGILWNAAAPEALGATLPTSSAPDPTGGTSSAFKKNEGTIQQFGKVDGLGTITDIGILNVTNLYNEGVISDVDVAINVSYTLVNNETGILDGYSPSHVEWDYSLPPVRNVVFEDTYGILRVGKSTEVFNPVTGTFSTSNPLVLLLQSAGLSIGNETGIVNAGIITNFDQVISEGDMYNAAIDATRRGKIFNILSTLTVGGDMINEGDIGEYEEDMFGNVIVSEIGAKVITVGGIMVNTGTISNVEVLSVLGIADADHRLVMSGQINEGIGFTSMGDLTNIGVITVADGMISAGDIKNVTSITVGSTMPTGNVADMYIAGSLTNVTSVTVTRDLYLLSNPGMGAGPGGIIPGPGLPGFVPSKFDNVGTISAGREIIVDTVIDGGYAFLAAGGGRDAAGNRSGQLFVTADGELTVAAGSIASGWGVWNEGIIWIGRPEIPAVPGLPGMPGMPVIPAVPGGTLNSGAGVRNEAGAYIYNNGTISAGADFINFGTISGKGIVSFTNSDRFGEGRTFTNRAGGVIEGGLVINGNFSNQGGTIRLVTERRNGREEAETIRVTNGAATINGGTVDTSALEGLNVNRQYLFLATDRPGDLIITKNMVGGGSGAPGSVLDFSPYYGRYDSENNRYIPGELWSMTNQYYWLEVGRAYTYENYAKTYNQIAVGKYIDTIGGSVKGKQEDNILEPSKMFYKDVVEPSGMISNANAFRNLLIQLDGISDNRDYVDAHGNSWFHPDFAEHQGKVNPVAIHALDQLSGITYANLGPASVHNVGVVNRSLADILRSDVFKFSMIGNPNNAIRGQAIAPLRYSRWATLFGIGGTTCKDGNAIGYRQSFGGVLAGVDRSMWTGTRVGGWLSLAAGDVTTKDAWINENADVINIMVGMYLRQEMYYGYGLLSAGFGADEYKTERNLWLLGHRAESKFNGAIGTAYLERGIDIPIYYATLQPYTSFQVVSASQDSFKEKMWNQLGQNAKIGLEGLSGNTDSYKWALGARSSSMPVPFRWGQVALTTNAAWFHEFNKDNRSFSARFANPGGANFAVQNTKYTIKGTNPKQDWFNFGFGLNMDRNSTRLFLNADLFANEQQTLFSGGGGFITSW